MTHIHPDWQDWNDDTDDSDIDQEVPYCDECGSILVTNTACTGDRCKRTHLHCTNENCGNSPHLGEHWL